MKTGVLIPVLVGIILALMVGVIAVTELDRDTVCADTLGDDWDATRNETLRDEMGAYTVCEHENGTLEPVRFDNSTAAEAIS